MELEFRPSVKMKIRGQSLMTFFMFTNEKGARAGKEGESGRVTKFLHVINFINEDSFR